MTVLFLKAHNKGYTKKTGAYVAPFDDKRPSAKILFPKESKFAGSFNAKFLGKQSAPSQWKPSPYKGEDDDAPIAWRPGKWSGQGSLFGDAVKAAPKEPAAWHPKKDDAGKPMPIWKPSAATDAATWADGGEVATFVPGGKFPAALNGVALAPWTDHPQTIEGWDYVDGQMDDLDEPAMKLPPGKEAAAGVLVEEPDGRVWVVHPTNGFAGYKTTFPKGHADDGLSLQASAIKECFEEAGLKVRITGLVGDVERGSTMTRYYRAVRVGGTPAEMGWESQAVSLVPKEMAADFVNSGYDKTVAAKGGYGAGTPAESIAGWKKVGAQAGSNPGGQYEDASGVRWYCKFPADPGIARNEALACRLYAEAGVAAPEVKLIRDGEKIGVASKMVDVKKDQKAVTSGKLPGVYEGFAADAWLANWDVAGTGFDNLLVGVDGKAMRIDAGGALVYRAQGSPKGAAFGDKVGEVDSLRAKGNPWSSAVFAGIKDSDIRAGVKRIAAIADDRIRELVMADGPGGVKARAALADRLIARKADLMQRFGVK